MVGVGDLRVRALHARHLYGLESTPDAVGFAQYRACERLPQRRLPVPVERSIRRPDSVPWKLAKDSGGIQESSSQLGRTGKAWASSGSEPAAIAGRVPAELCRPWVGERAVMSSFRRAQSVLERSGTSRLLVARRGMNGQVKG